MPPIQCTRKCEKSGDSYPIFDFALQDSISQPPVPSSSLALTVIRKAAVVGTFPCVGQSIGLKEYIPIFVDIDLVSDLYHRFKCHRHLPLAK